MFTTARYHVPGVSHRLVSSTESPMVSLPVAAVVEAADIVEEEMTEAVTVIKISPV